MKWWQLTWRMQVSRDIREWRWLNWCGSIKSQKPSNKRAGYCAKVTGVYTTKREGRRDSRGCCCKKSESNARVYDILIGNWQVRLSHRCAVFNWRCVAGREEMAMDYEQPAAFFCRLWIIGRRANGSPANCSTWYCASWRHMLSHRLAKNKTWHNPLQPVLLRAIDGRSHVKGWCFQVLFFSANCWEKL